MKGLLVLSIVCYISSVLCDIVFMNTHDHLFKYLYWALLVLASFGSVSYCILCYRKTIRTQKDNDDAKQDIRARTEDS